MHRSHLARALLAPALLVLPLVGLSALPPADATGTSAVVARPTIQAPRTVVAGETGRVTGTAAAGPVVLQAGSSVAGPWHREARLARQRAAYAFVVAPTATTFYRVVAHARTSPAAKVRVVAAEPVYVWTSLQDLGSVAGTADPAFHQEYTVQLGDDYYSDSDGPGNVTVDLPPSPGATASLVWDLGGSCTRLRTHAGLQEPYSDDPASVRLLGDDRTLLERTFGVGQRQDLVVDVTGVHRLRVEATRISGSGDSLPTLAGLEARCDRHLRAHLPDTTGARWSPLTDRGSVDGSADPAFADEYSLELAGISFSRSDGPGNLAADLVDSATTAWIEYDLRGRCSRLDVSLGLEEPYSDSGARIRVLTDGAVALDRDFGPGQRQHLSLDVAGVHRLRFDADRLTDTGDDVLPAVAAPEVYCTR
ncbi:MAG: hypothetical protein ACXVW1_05945 [Nocardioides sp.]